MFKLTIEVDNRKITQDVTPEDYGMSVISLQNGIGREYGWITLYATNHGVVILSSDHLRRAFIKFEEVPCER